MTDGGSRRVDFAVRMLDGYEEAELVAARVTACTRATGIPDEEVERVTRELFEP